MAQTQCTRRVLSRPILSEATLLGAQGLMTLSIQSLLESAQPRITSDQKAEPFCLMPTRPLYSLRTTSQELGWVRPGIETKDEGLSQRG